jgi:hypothetical protein
VTTLAQSDQWGLLRPGHKAYIKSDFGLGLVICIMQMASFLLPNFSKALRTRLSLFSFSSFF